MLLNGTRDARDITPHEWVDIIARIEGGEPVRAVAADVNVSRVTVRRRYRRKDTTVSRRGPKPALSAAGERAFAGWMVTNHSFGRSVPRAAAGEQARRLAGDICDPRFVGGRTFMRAFMKRNPQLSNRTAEVTERGRMYALAPGKLQEYFQKIKPLIEGRGPKNLWNIDESGFDGMHIQTGKVIAPKGAKQVQVGCDIDRSRISYCWFFNAAGDHTPPIILLPGQRASKTKNEIMLAFPEAHYVYVDCATQTEETWAKCAEFFVGWLDKNHPGGNHLLFVDGHSSRVSMDAITAFRTSGVELFSLPPHGTHVLQPYDVGVAKAFKSHLDKALALIRLGDDETPGQSITRKNIMRGFKMAFHETMAPRVDQKTGDMYTIASRAFAKAGIWPFNPDVVDKALMKPAEWFEANVASQKASPPPLTQDERAAAVEKRVKVLMEAGDLKLQLEKRVKPPRPHVVPGCTLLTGDEHIARALAMEQLKAAEVAAIEEKRAARKVASAASKAAKLERAARIEAKKAAKAAAAGNRVDATAPAAATAPAKAPKGKGVKRKREGAPEVGFDEVEASRQGAGVRRAARMAARLGEDE